MPSNMIKYGRSVVDGRVRFLSPSGIEKADASSHNGGGCLLKWHFKYVMGFKEKQGKAAELGDTCHKELDRYLTTGDNVLGRIAGAVKRFAPMPKSIGVHVELPLGGFKEDLSEALVKIEDVPIVMYLDVVDRRGQYLDESGEAFFDDPLNTIEYLDWKFGAAKVDGPKSYAKKGHQLRDDTQMVLGGYGVLEHFKGEHARLSHVYTNTEGTPVPTKASTRMDVDDLELRIDHISGVVRTIKDVAKEVDPRKVPGNTYACLSYGGCSFIESCEHWKQKGGLESFYGRTDLETLKGINMGILDGVNFPGMAPVTATPSGVAATVPLVPQASAHDVMAQLANVANAASPGFTPAFPTPEFNSACMFIEQKGYGMVGLTGAAAQMYLQFRGDKRPITPTSEVSGYGHLAGKTISDPAIVIAISKDLGAHPQNPSPVQRPEGQLVLHAPTPQAPAQLGILSPSAPQSNPALAADPVPGYGAPTPSVQVPGLMASVPPAVSAAVLVEHAQPAAPGADLPPEGKPKRKYTRRAKSDDVAQPEQAIATGGGNDGLWLFVNARPNINVIDLHGWTQARCDEIAKHHKLIIPDIRTAPKDHPLAFGAWKGVLTAWVRECASKLEPGAYFLRMHSEISECTLEGLRAATQPDSTDPVFELVVFGES